MPGKYSSNSIGCLIAVGFLFFLSYTVIKNNKEYNRKANERAALRLYLDVTNLLSNQKFTEASEIITTEINNKNPRFLYEMGKIHLNDGDVIKAYAHFAAEEFYDKKYNSMINVHISDISSEELMHAYRLGYRIYRYISGSLEEDGVTYFDIINKHDDFLVRYYTPSDLEIQTREYYETIERLANEAIEEIDRQRQRTQALAKEQEKALHESQIKLDIILDRYENR